MEVNDTITKQPESLRSNDGEIAELIGVISENPFRIIRHLRDRGFIEHRNREFVINLKRFLLPNIKAGYEIVFNYFESLSQIIQEFKETPLKALWEVFFMELKVKKAYFPLPVVLLSSKRYGHYGLLAIQFESENRFTSSRITIGVAQFTRQEYRADTDDVKQDLKRVFRHLVDRFLSPFLPIKSDFAPTRISFEYTGDAEELSALVKGKLVAELERLGYDQFVSDDRLLAAIV